MCYRYNILKIKIFSGTEILFFLLLCMLPPIFLPGLAVFAASERDEILITLNENESLRQLSERLLGDENAWSIILRYNGIAHPDAVPSGALLRIPVGLYTTLHQHLKKTALLISKANQEGAALLAENNIAEAVRLRDQALSLKQEARLQEAIEQATQAEAKAQVALDKAKNMQIHAAEAWLAAKSGTVQNRSSGTSDWQETKLQQRLQEREKVRTLADSRCRIKFSDQSQLSLDEHALVVIGSMEKNIIRSSYSNSVSMIKGDVLVHLASLNQQKRFRVNLPDISTDVRSLNFLTSRDTKNVTRIANYDGELDIRAAGGQVTVKKNQGTKIVPGHQPTPPKELLPPPSLLTPQPEQKLYKTEVLFTWEPINNARRYQIEVSTTAMFAFLLVSEKISTSYFQWNEAPKGNFFVRIKTIDEDKCPGAHSEPLHFFIAPDTLPPYLVLHAPNKDVLVRGKIFEVRGEVEKDAVVRINDQQVEADKNGLFRYTVSLSNENTVINVEAEDLAGNVSTIERRLTRQQDSQLIWLDNPKTIFSNTKEVVVSGRLAPGVQLRINREPIQVAQTFTHVLSLAEGEHRLDVEAVGADGQQDTQRLQAVVDLHPPKIQVKDIAQATADQQIVLSGTVSEQGTLTLNNRPVRLSDRVFKETVSLSEGDNELLLVAKDLAGNWSSWKRTVVLDSQPPEIIQKKLSVLTTKGGEAVGLTVWIRNSGVGTERSGSFTLEINRILFRGTLKRAERTEEDDITFAGNVFVLPGVAGAVKVRDIRIEDMLGNAAEYFAEDTGKE